MLLGRVGGIKEVGSDESDEVGAITAVEETDVEAVDGDGGDKDTLRMTRLLIRDDSSVFSSPSSASDAAADGDEATRPILQEVARSPEPERGMDPWSIGASDTGPSPSFESTGRVSAASKTLVESSRGINSRFRGVCRAITPADGELDATPGFSCRRAVDEEDEGDGAIEKGKGRGKK